jgi:ABC-type transport system involved in multi-copper enzyme maturation permease subunit
MIAPERNEAAVRPEQPLHVTGGLFAPIERVTAVAALTMKESARKKVAVGMIICSVLMTLALGLVARSMQLTDGSETGLMFALNGLLRVVAGFTWVLALFISVTAIPPELERRTTYTLFAKPLDRFEWVFGKFLGCCGLLAVNLCIVAAIVALMLWSGSRGIAIALMLDLATFFVSYTALIALAISFTLVLPMAVAGLVALGVYFLGTVHGMGLQVANTEGLWAGWRMLGAFVYHLGVVISPRTNWLNVDRPAVSVIDTSQPLAIAAVLAYSLAVLIIASMAFSRREL